MKKAEAMQKLSECLRLQRYSRNTIKVYSEWLDRYINFLVVCHAIRKLEELHAGYAAARVPVSLPDKLDKKYPNAPYSWEWFWLFPAAGPCVDPKWEGKLYHVHNTAVQKRVRRAVLAARIPKKVGCHSFRHSFATHWLENADGNHEIALKRLQELLGHKDVKTTMVYLHLLPKLDNVASPLDCRKAA